MLFSKDVPWASGIGSDSDGGNENIEGETEGLDEAEEDADGKRAITWQMATNKGLIHRRKKEDRNPRLKNRKKYRKAQIRIKGQVMKFIHCVVICFSSFPFHFLISLSPFFKLCPLSIRFANLELKYSVMEEKFLALRKLSARVSKLNDVGHCINLIVVKENKSDVRIMFELNH